VFAAFAVAASFDWVWQLPVIAGVAIACLALLVGAMSEDPNASPVRARSSSARAVALATVVVLLPLFLLATLDTATQLRLERSVHEAGRGDGSSALAEAQAARALEPWSAKPLLRLALTEERFGSLQVARAAIEQAVRKDSADWRLHLIAARLQTKVGDIRAASRSLDAARALNPRSPLFEGSP
jgi:hypothetical protein